MVGWYHVCPHLPGMGTDMENSSIHFATLAGTKRPGVDMPRTKKPVQ
jgi:hypothetical protein